MCHRATAREDRQVATLTSLIAVPLLLISCTNSPLGPAEEAPPSGSGPEALVLQPQQIQLLPADSVRFSALFRDRSGRIVLDTVAWEAGGGTITEDGLFVAGYAHGSYKVIAKRKNGKRKGRRMADTALVVIDTVAPAQPAAIAVEPGDAELAPGESVQFAATVTDEAGAVIDAAVTWTASGGVVDGSGQYTAGPAGGDFEVVSRAADDVVDTARVSIRLLDNAPPEAAFTASCTDLECTFDASASSDSDGSIESYAWTFGDGAESSGPAPRYSYASAGTYDVGLTVTDDRGASDAATRTVTLDEPPALDGVPIHPGDDIQSVVNQYPSGTTFLLKAGVHRRQEITPKDRMTFNGEAGAVLDGEGQAEFAFGGYGIPGREVTIRGLTIQNYAPRELHFGAILGDNAVDWRVLDNVVRDNAGIGIRLGPGMFVSGNTTYGNWNLGIGGFNPHGAVIENNEIYGNGFAGRSGEHAGLKIVGGRDVVLRGNHAHDNTGRGLWLDTDIFDAVVENNIVQDNSLEGIWLEVVCGAVIRDNLSERNGLGGAAQSHWPDKAGIQVVNGTDVEIYGNTLSGNQNGIAVIAANGYPTNHECMPDVRNVYVHDNTVSMQSGLTGLVQNYGDRSFFTSRGNRFEANTYYLGSESEYFIWDDRRMSEAEWRDAGQDVNGDFNR
jgi:nitrous oxidase accessory protein NosD